MELDGTPAPTPSLTQTLPAWDLSQICPDAESCLQMLDAAGARMKRFATTYRGRLGSLDAAGLRQALDELCETYNQFGRAGWYAGLREELDHGSKANQDLQVKVQNRSIEYGNQLIFVDLEWQAVPAAQAAALAAEPELAPYRHYLEQLTATAKHSLSEPEERIVNSYRPLTTKWRDTFSKTISAINHRFGRGPAARAMTLDEMLAKRHSTDPKIRRATLRMVFHEVGKRAPIAADVYDAIITSRLISDRLRGFTSPMQQANMSNDLADGVVDNLIGAVVANYPLGQRWFRIKAGLLGQKQLSLYDQYAPLGKSGSCTFDQAKQLVLTATGDFSPAAASILAGFFTSRIDAAPREGKQGGAFCSSGPSDMDPFVLMNFTGTDNDAMTLAHELGHGLHMTLANRAQTALTADTGMAMAEIASTFNEMLAFDYLMGRPGLGDEERLGLLAARVEDSIATIFRQVMMAKYEQRAYAEVAAGNQLGPEILNEFWLDENRKQYGDSVKVPDGYKTTWAYISHFINSRFYTYSYAFAHIASLTLYGKYREAKAEGRGAEFADRYLQMLAAGGSKSPADLLGAMGIDLNDSNWADAGFAEFSRIVDMAGELAERLPAAA